MIFNLEKAMRTNSLHFFQWCKEKLFFICLIFHLFFGPTPLMRCGPKALPDKAAAIIPVTLYELVIRLP
jgi:hypothetical protein